MGADGLGLQVSPECECRDVSLFCRILIFYMSDWLAFVSIPSGGISMVLTLFCTDRDCARWKLTPAEVQKRRALFWELFITDCWQVKCSCSVLVI